MMDRLVYLRYIVTKRITSRIIIQFVFHCFDKSQFQNVIDLHKGMRVLEVSVITINPLFLLSEMVLILIEIIHLKSYLY